MHWQTSTLTERSQMSQVFQVTSYFVELFALHIASPIQLLSLYHFTQCLTCTRIPCRYSHCEDGSFEVLSLHLCVQFLRRIVALLSRSSHRVAMIHRHCIQQTFHIPLIQLNMPTKFINKDATFEKMSFTLVFRFQTQFQTSSPENVY